MGLVASRPRATESRFRISVPVTPVRVVSTMAPWIVLAYPSRKCCPTYSGGEHPCLTDFASGDQTGQSRDGGTTAPSHRRSVEPGGLPRGQDAEQQEVPR